MKSIFRDSTVAFNGVGDIVGLRVGSDEGAKVGAEDVGALVGEADGANVVSAQLTMTDILLEVRC